MGWVKATAITATLGRLLGRGLLQGAQDDQDGRLLGAKLFVRTAGRQRDGAQGPLPEEIQDIGHHRTGQPDGEQEHDAGQQERHHRVAAGGGGGQDLVRVHTRFAVR